MFIVHSPNSHMPSTHYKQKRKCRNTSVPNQYKISRLRFVLLFCPLTQAKRYLISRMRRSEDLVYQRFAQISARLFSAFIKRFVANHTLAGYNWLYPQYICPPQVLIHSPVSPTKSQKRAIFFPFSFFSHCLQTWANSSSSSSSAPIEGQPRPRRHSYPLNPRKTLSSGRIDLRSARLYAGHNLIGHFSVFPVPLNKQRCDFTHFLYLFPFFYPAATVSCSSDFPCLKSRL